MQGVCRCLVVLALAAVAAPSARGQAPTPASPSASRPIHIDDGFLRAKDLRHWQRVVAAQSGVHKGWKARRWRLAAAAFLIEHRWIELEAKELGVKVTRKETVKRYRAIRRELYPRSVDYRRYLRRTRSTTKDVLHAVRIDLLNTRVSSLVTAGSASPTEAQERLYAYRNARFEKYRPRTTCTKRWRVVEFCA